MKFPAVSISGFLLAALWNTPIFAEDSDQPILSLSSDESFHFELLGPLGQALFRGADIGPVLQAAKLIDPGNFSSFSDVFHTLANKTKAQAEDPANAYDSINVRDTWFSAATYFRRADFYLHGEWDNPLINSLWDEQISAFDKAISALPIPGQRLSIAADNFTVEAIWYSATDENYIQRPTIILCNGYDGAQEDLYHTIVVPALERGWNALTFEGPGHPLVRRRQNLGFIPDWERVVTPVVDYVLSEKGHIVDSEQLVLFGYSFGGYLAARAAAYEPRLSAVMVNGGVWNVYDAFTSELSPDFLELLESGDKEAFDEAAEELRTSSETPTEARWGLEQGMWAFNKKSAYEFLTATKQYTLENVVDEIKMPVWIADAEYEGFFSGQSELVKEALGEKATLHLFKGPAGYHCQTGAYQELTRTMFSWLNVTLA
ncbi:Alpha/Beta hydrolase protein [Thelonectria olida]|uniref:Alpha/Beta hydrolase protein n=1 Tax=Thelonectria olida TaxID=1576542 RepID=A0A9P8W8X9_9HYPO|nr:Alpha/Beta hydrolase protein [Thelonectria olida]